jgi:PAS domain S-box-containing protein
LTAPLDPSALDALLDAAPDAMIVVNAAGTIVLVNTQAESLFAYPRAVLVGQPIETLVPEVSRGAHRAHREGFAAAPHARSMGSGMELAGRRRDGSEFPAEISLSAVDTASGHLVAAAVRDVTERKRADEKFRELLEAAPDAIVGVNTGGNIAIVNAQAEKLFGYERDELIGEPIEILVPLGARDRHPEHRARYLSDPHPRPMGGGMELAARRKDGSEFPAEISLSALDTDDGMLVSAAIRDGTDRRQAAIISSSSDAIISQTLDGAITTWNPAAARMYGYEAVDILGRNIDVLIPAENRVRERALLASVAAGQHVAEYEAVRIRADGTRIDIARTASPILDAAGVVIGVSTIARDITERTRAAAERRSLEDRLNQSQRLESLGQLAGGIAHDFNNLLAVILNYATFVAEEIPEHAPARADLDQIRIAAERAAGLTHQLLIFGRRETIQPEILDLNAAVTEVQTLLSRTIGEHVDLVVRAAPDLPSVIGDRGQLEQVLVNLAVNARDAMPDGGTLTIETSAATIDEESARLRPGLRAGHYVTLAVSDTGSGMSPEVIGHAFEPFFTTKPKGEGTGLGLATVYGIVTEAGGAVVLYSEGGLGTTVRVYLPASTAAIAPPAPDRRPDPRQGNGEIVLVVEDEQAMREVALRILVRNGYNVLEASGGREALSILESQECDLLLTDVIMPNMLGPELAARIHERHPGLPVLYMSGYSEGVLGPQRLLDDTIALIQKPFDEHALVERVGAMLEGSQLTREAGSVGPLRTAS